MTKTPREIDISQENIQDIIGILGASCYELLGEIIFGELRLAEREGRDLIVKIEGKKQHD